ncbi:MAG: DUF4097 domain-containing protein [Pirellulaceae bacterium]
MRSAVLLLVGCVPVLSGCIGIPRYSATRTETKELATEPLTALDLSTFNGDVNVRSWDKPEVVMEINYKAYGTSEEAANANCETLTCDIQAEDGTLILKATKPSNQWSAAADFTITAPIDCGLKIHTSNGNVDIADFVAGANIKTSNGKIKLRNMADVVVAGSSNGTIDAAGMQGPVDFDTSNGRIMYSGRLVGEDNKFTTSNGRVEISLPEDSLTEVTAKTSNGRVKCDIPEQEVFKQKKNSMHVLVGTAKSEEPAAKANVRSSNGSITIKAIEEMEVVPGDMPTTPEGSEQGLPDIVSSESISSGQAEVADSALSF